MIVKTQKIRTAIFVIICVSCVDEFQVDGLKSGRILPAVIDGFISNGVGPYIIKVTQSFDVGQVKEFNLPYRVKNLILSDNVGQKEVLTEVEEGVYQINSIKGVIGNSYKLRVEFLDGRVYESVPDTLLANGKIDSVFTNYDLIPGESRYRVFANSRASANNNRYLWKMRSTFKATTRPEVAPPNGGCFFFEGKCNTVPPCSGYRNIGNSVIVQLVQLFPCDCCTCWYDIYNSIPIISDDFSAPQEYAGLQIGSVPVNGWTFMEKMRIEVTMRSLSKLAYNYFNTIRTQREAAESLFQPAIGRIPLNFIQLEGANQNLYGLFYACGIASKSIYINKSDVPRSDLLPTPQDYFDRHISKTSCLTLFPNATNVKPVFWKD